MQWKPKVYTYMYLIAQKGNREKYDINMQFSKQISTDCGISPIIDVQWNFSNPDTIGADSSVLNREVSLIQGLLSTQMWHLGRVNMSYL